MKLILTLLFIVAFSPPLMAMELCDALKHDKTYEGKTSYLKLEAGKGDWVFRTKTDYKTDFKVNSALENRFSRLYAALKVHNIEMVIAPLPTRGMMHADQSFNNDYKVQDAVDSYKTLVKKLRQIGFYVADIDDFKELHDFYYKADHHWNAKGAETLAKQVANRIKAIPAYADIKKEKFVTEAEKEIDFTGTFAEFIAKKCGGKPLVEKASVLKTYKVDSSEEDLFSDVSKPEIILLGTSNSSPKPSYANFEGALKEHIGADVQNMSVSGGGVETAALDYFNAGMHIKDNPKILIWEIPIYQNFKGGPLYRQLIPAVYGSCEGEEVFKVKKELSGKDFFVTLPENITTKNHYMVLNFSEPKERKFKVKNHYNEGGVDDFNVRLSKYSTVLGKHFIEFDQNKDKTVEKIEGSFKKEINGELELLICRYSSSE